MALPQQFAIPDFHPADAADPQRDEINQWADQLTGVINALDNIINFFRLQTPTIPVAPQLPARGANLAARQAHVNILTTLRMQVVMFQGMVFAEASALVARPSRPTIKVQRPTFDGKPENARGFLAGAATYRHLRANDFPDDETFITWALACMDGPVVNPWKNALLYQGATIHAAGGQMPNLFTNWADFLIEFNGKFLDPNETENAGRALMALRQTRSAREFAQEFD